MFEKEEKRVTSQDFKPCTVGLLTGLWCLGNRLRTAHTPWLTILCTVPVFVCNGCEAEEDLGSPANLLFAVVSCRTKRIVGGSFSVVPTVPMRRPAWPLS